MEVRLHAPDGYGRITRHKRPRVYLSLEAASIPLEESIGKPSATYQE